MALLSQTFKNHEFYFATLKDGVEGENALGAYGSHWK